MVLGLFSCCTGGSAQNVQGSGQGPSGKNGDHLADEALATKASLADTNVRSSAEAVPKKLGQLVQDLLVRLPQVTGHTWISRVEASMILLSTLAEVDAASVAVVVPAEGDGAGSTAPYASIVCGSGLFGSVLQHYQQAGNKAAAMAAARCGEEPFTSSQLLLSAPHGEVLLMSSDTSGPGPGDMLLTMAGPMGTLGVSSRGELPTDWAAVAAATHLRHFCGLPLRVGPRLLAVVTLAWAAPCPVPPALRSRCTTGRGMAAGGGLPRTSQHPSSQPAPRGSSDVFEAGACGTAAGAQPAASQAERSCLIQMAQVLCLGLFGDGASVVYGQKVARMIHVMMLAGTLQAVLDGLLAGVRDILLHRCQQDLAATLALKHTSAPTAAFILEGRPSLLSPPLASVPSRAGTATGHVTAPPASGPPRSGGGPTAGGVGNSAPGGSIGQHSASGQPPRGARQAAALTHPAPQRSANAPGSGPAAAPSPGISAPGMPTGHPGNSAGGGGGGHPTYTTASQQSAYATASFNNAMSNAANSSMNLSSVGAGAGAGGAAGSGAGRGSTSSHFRRGRSGDVRSGGAAAVGAAAAAAAGGTVGTTGTGGTVGAISGMLRHSMSVDLNGSMDADCDVPSTVHAHITSLAHTLLMASLSALAPPGAGDEPAGPAAGASGAATTSSTSRYGHLSGASDRGDPLTAPSGRRDLGGYMPLQGRHSGAGRLVGATASSSGVGGGGGQAGAVAATVTPQGCVIPNCHLHLQDESLPCRDLVLVQKLARMPVQSLVLVVVRPADLVANLMGAQLMLAPGGGSNAGPAGHAAATASTSPSTAPDSASHNATVLASTLPPLGIYLTSAEPLARSALQGVMAEAREAVRLAAAALYRQMTSDSLRNEWNGLLEAMSTAAYAGGISFGSSRMVSLLRPRSCNVLHEQPSGELLSYGIVNSPSRGHLGTSPGVLSSELSKPLASGRLVVDSSVETPLQQLDAMVSSIQSTLSAVQLQLDVPGNAAEMQEIRLNDIAAVELMEIIGRGGQGVVFRGVVHGIEAAVKVISHRDETEAGAKSAPGSNAGEKRSTAGGDGSTRRGAGMPAALDSPALVVDEARMRERKRNLLRDALELAVTTTISHPNIVQMYGYFTDCVVVQYANQSNRLKLLPADSEALQQYGSQRGPVNTVMCMEYCDAGTLKSVAEGGAFRMPGVSAKSGPACPALVPLYTSLLELALALRHLHSRRLVHCDLKPSNVLLKSSLRDPRGWICKLSDFGCVRVMSEEGEEGRLGFRQPQPLGTLTHMAPEMFVRGGLLDGGVDIYAFGIIMWELIMVAPLYDGTVPKEKLPSMIRRGLRPIFHPLVPPEYRMLATACWQEDPRRRPSAAVLVSMLQRLLARAQAGAAAPGSGSSAGSGRGSKSMSSSFSGVAPQHAAAAAAAAAAGASASPAAAPPEGDAASSSGAATPSARHMYGGVPRRNTVASNLGLSAGGGSAAGGGQRQGFSPPVSSPLSREAGPAARAAVRVGDGGGPKPPATRVVEPAPQHSSPGGSANMAALSPLGTGLGTGAQPAAAAATATAAAEAAAGSNAAAVAAAAGGAATSTADPGNAEGGASYPRLSSPLLSRVAHDTKTPPCNLGAGVNSTSPGDGETRPSSLLGIGITAAADPGCNSSAGAAAVGATTTSSAAGLAGAAAAAAAAAATVAPLSVEAVRPAAIAAAARDSTGAPDSMDGLPVRGSAFVSGPGGPLTTSTGPTANTGELIGL